MRKRCWPDLEKWVPKARKGISRRLIERSFSGRIPVRRDLVSSEWVSGEFVVDCGGLINRFVGLTESIFFGFREYLIW